MKNFIEFEIKSAKVSIAKISIAVNEIIAVQDGGKGTIIHTSIKQFNLDKPYTEVMKLVQAAQG